MVCLLEDLTDVFENGGKTGQCSSPNYSPFHLGGGRGVGCVVHPHLVPPPGGGGGLLMLCIAPHSNWEGAGGGTELGCERTANSFSSKTIRILKLMGSVWQTIDRPSHRNQNLIQRN